MTTEPQVTGGLVGSDVLLGVSAKMVNERSDYGQGYAENKFGFCIGDRVWWVGIEGYGHDSKEADEQKKLCCEIVKRWNEPSVMRAALQEIDAECSGALNNGFPEDAPETVSHVRGIAVRALSSPNVEISHATKSVGTPDGR